MANEFIIKHGFHSDGNSQITGSLDISDSLTVNGGAVGAAFPFTGDAQITGSLLISGSNPSIEFDRTIIIGSGSGENVTTGVNNIIIGDNAGNNLSTTSHNVIIGKLSAGGQSAGGSANVYVGYEAGFNGNNASYNVGVGYQSLKGLSDSNGYYNVALGYRSGLDVNSGIGNVLLGYNAGYNVSSGDYNTLVGYQNAYNLSTGNYNTFLGTNNGGSVTGDNNIIIGYKQGSSLTNGNNNIFIGSGSAGASGMENQLQIGISPIVTISASLATGDIIFYNTASAPNFSGSFQGDGSQLTGISTTPFPFTGNAQITGSLSVSGSGIEFKTSGGTVFSIAETGSFTLGEGANSNNIDTAVAIGKSATANGTYDIAIGGNSNASGGNSVAIGRSAGAGADGIAIGLASAGANGIAMGQSAAATSNGVSIGYDSETPGQSISLGANAKSSGANSITLNANGSATSTSNTKAFKVFMSSNTTPDFVISASNESKLSGSSFTIEKSGSTVFSVIGSEGDLFTITDNLTTGSLFAVKDISGIPLLDVTANSTIPDVVTVGQSNLLLDSGSLEVIGSISASGDVTGRLQRPTQEFGTNFTASAEYSGYYLRTGGNVTCSIQANALPSINSEFDFFQTSSVGNMLFETGSTSVILNSKNNNLNLAGQFSSATLKYVGNNTFDLMGDLT